MSRSSVPLVIVVTHLLMRVSNSLKYEEVKEAFDQGMSNYNPNIRPVLQQTDRIDVSLAFYLMRISAIHESDKTMQSTGFLVVIWRDQVMEKWLNPLCNRSEKVGCSSLFEMAETDRYDEDANNYLHVSPSKLWLPDLRLHNAIRKFGFDRVDALLSLYYTGDVMWVPGGEFETFCEMDVRKFPFDKHICHFDIGPWQSNREIITSQTIGADLMYFEKDGEWQIINTQLSNASYIIGGCCRYTIEIRRRPEILVSTMILPTTVLSFLGSLVFLLPTESGERMSLSVSVTLALVLYLTIIQDILPRSVTKPSYFEILLCSQVILNLLNIFVNVINIYIYHGKKTARLARNSVMGTILITSFKRFHDQEKHLSTGASNDTTTLGGTSMDLHDMHGPHVNDNAMSDGMSVSKESMDGVDNTIVVSGMVWSKLLDKLFLVISILVNVVSVISFIVMTMD